MQTEQLHVTGMTCGGCVSNITAALKAISGVGDIKVSLAEGDANVEYDERLTSPEQLIVAVRAAGYDVEATKSGHAHKSKGGCCG